MATDFPTSLDSLTNPTATDSMGTVSHSSQHISANDAIEALEAKVGVDSSAVATSLDYLVSNASSEDPGHTHTVSGISSGSLSGSDTTLITGTAGTSGDIAIWNTDGDVVDGPTPPSGTIVGTSDTQTLTNKRITPRTSTEASSATPTINTDSVDMHTITALAVDITSMTTNLSGTPTNGQALKIRILDNGSARAIAWGASFASRGATLPTTTKASKYLYVGLIYNSTASIWDCIAVSEES